MGKLLIGIISFAVLVLISGGYFTFKWISAPREENPVLPDDGWRPSSKESYQEKEAEKAVDNSNENSYGDGGSEGSKGGSDSGDMAKSEQKVEEPSANLNLLDFEYEIVEKDLAKVKSITYNIRDMNIPMNCELFLFVYDENDDDSNKGLVRAQIRIGYLDLGQTIEQKSTVSAFYRGDISTAKTLKLSLVGYLTDQSYTLASDESEAIFSQD